PRRVYQALQADVLVRPQRPARVLLVVDRKLVAQDLVALLVHGGVAGVDGPELAHPQRRAGLPLEARALGERALQLVAVAPLAARVAGVRACAREPGKPVGRDDGDRASVHLPEHRTA